MRRRELIAGLAAATAAPAVLRAQSAPKVQFILWVSTEAQPDPFIAGFREGMRERGYIEGQNLAFVLRYAPGDPTALRAMLPELLATPADLIVSSGPAILAMRATTDKPVLFAVSGDPVALGIAQSLSRPGRNFTGSSFLSLELAQKRVQLVRELLPALKTLAILSQANHPGEPSEHDATARAADALRSSSRMCPSAPAPSSTTRSSACGLRTPRRCSCFRTASPWSTAPRSRSSPSASSALDVRLARVLRRRRACELWRQPARHLPAPRDLRGSDPARREAC